MKPSPRNVARTVLVLAVVAGIPLAVLAYQSHRTGMSWSELLREMFARAGAAKTGLEGAATAALPDGQPVRWFEPRPIGDDFEQPPQISNLAVVDLDADGLLDVVVCDCQANRVSWIRQHPRGRFTERVCAGELIAPAHVEAVDFDRDGDLDLMVAVLGMLFPNNDRIGSVVILENDGHTKFRRRVVVDRVARVSDVRAGDLDGDGDLDLAVAQFGYDDGQTRWIENLGAWRFESHVLQNLSGPIHCEIADLDGDGHRDLVVLVSQEWEEIFVFAGNGRGEFRPTRIFGSDNPDFGSSSIALCDFDGDGDTDVLYTNGDAFDYLPPAPRPWHGVQWLENVGQMEFRFHRIADFAGAANARPFDFDGDGDLDLVVASAYNHWDHPQSQSLILLENDGAMRFRRRDVTNTPTHILALELGDFDGDGRLDLVTGGMHTYAPYNRLGRVTLWLNRRDVPHP